METIPTPDPYFWYIMSGLLGTALLFILGFFLNRLIAMIDRHDKEIVKIQMVQVQQGKDIDNHEQRIDDIEKNNYPVNYKNKR